jgi:hypothetical protein
MPKENFRPGQSVPDSGIYAEVNTRGNLTGRNVTCVEGEPFPATQASGYKYVMKTPTNP